MFSGKCNPKIKIPAKKERTVRLSKARPKKPFRSPSPIKLRAGFPSIGKFYLILSAGTARRLSANPPARKSPPMQSSVTQSGQLLIIHPNNIMSKLDIPLSRALETDKTEALAAEDATMRFNSIPKMTLNAPQINLRKITSNAQAMPPEKKPRATKAQKASNGAVVLRNFLLLPIRSERFAPNPNANTAKAKIRPK